MEELSLTSHKYLLASKLVVDVTGTWSDDGCLPDFLILLRLTPDGFTSQRETSWTGKRLKAVETISVVRIHWDLVLTYFVSLQEFCNYIPFCF